MGSALLQCLSAAIIGSGNLLGSFMFVWPSYALPFLSEHEGFLEDKLTETQASQIGSLPTLGCALASMISGIVIDNLGRKRSLIFNGLLTVVSWSIICTTKSINMVLIARFILGLGSGLQIALSALFIGEISQPKLRGTLASFPVIFYNLGNLASYTMGWVCSLQVISYTTLSMSVGFVILGAMLKETPIFLLKKGLEKEALQSLKFYRGTSLTSQTLIDELDEMKSTVSNQDNEVGMDDLSEKHKMLEKDQDKQQEPIKKEDKNKSPSAWTYLRTSRGAKKSLLIVSVLLVQLVFMGSMAIQTYAGGFFKMAVPTLSSDLCAVCLALANIVGSALAMGFAEYLGRRVLMMVSSALVCICLVVLSSLLYTPWCGPWGVPGFILLYCCAMQFGACPLPAILLSEILEPKVRTLSTAMALVFTWVGNFILLATFNDVVAAIGLSGTMLIFALVAASAVVFTFCFLPETAGLSSSDIYMLYNKKNWFVGCRKY